MATFQYFAFISYQRKDEDWAEWLQHQLEHYHLPANIAADHPDIPQEIRPLFRDKTELAGGILAKEIRSALESSRFLIVLCSPNSAKSEWVDKEVQTFINMGRVAQIIPLIIGGIPYDEEQECFTPTLKKLRKTDNELLGINIAEMGREVASIKVVAQMLGLKFDTLWQRYEREKEDEERKLREQRDNLLRVQSFYLAEKSITLSQNGDAFLGRMLAMEALPKQIEDPEKPYVVEAEAALRNAWLQDSLNISQKTDRIAINGSGNLLAAIGEEYEISLWDLNTGVLSQILEGHYDHILDVAFLDDDTLISISSDATIKRWDVNAGVQVDTVEWHHDDDLALCSISPDGKTFAAINMENGYDIMLWNTLTGKLSSNETWPYTFISVKGFTFSQDSQLIAISSGDPYDMGIVIMTLEGKVKCRLEFPSQKPDDIDDETGQPVCTFDLSAISHIGEMSFSPNKEYLSVFLEDYNKEGRVEIWDLKNNEKLATIIKSKEKVKNIVFSPDGNLLLVTFCDCPPKLWEISYAKSLFGTRQLHTYSQLEVDTSNAGFLPNGKKIFCQYKGGVHILEWDVYPRPILSFKVNHTNILKKIDDTSFPVFVPDECIVCRKDYWFLTNDAYYAIFASYSKDNKKIVSASQDGNMRIWKTDNGTILLTLTGHDIPVRTCFFSSNSRYVIATYANATISVWDAIMGVELISFHAFGLMDGEKSYTRYPTDFDCIAALNEDCSQIISCCSASSLDRMDSMFSDGIVIKRIWNFPTLQQLINQTSEQFQTRKFSKFERMKYHLL